MVELHQAFFWDCEKCGHENLERAVAPSMSSEEIEFLQLQHNVPGDHFIYMAPTQVTCSKCQEHYTCRIPSLAG